ncbi:MAG: acyl carrier protein [Oscillospiraceae bacterium]|jgi:acyl carrier protein|nr:acyl carrier protein [Oscillospiraceae bacterium]
MTNFEKLQEIFRDVFDFPDMIITRDMTAEDVEDWDSLAQMNLVANAEATFSIQFVLDDMLSWKNIGDFYDCIESKLK